MLFYLLFSLFDLVNELFPTIYFALSAPEHFVIPLDFFRTFLNLDSYFVDGISSMFGRGNNKIVEVSFRPNGKTLLFQFFEFIVIIFSELRDRIVSPVDHVFFDSGTVLFPLIEFGLKFV